MHSGQRCLCGWEERVCQVGVREVYVHVYVRVVCVLWAGGRMTVSLCVCVGRACQVV